VDLSGKGRVHTASARPGGWGTTDDGKGPKWRERAANAAVATGILGHTRTLPDKKAGYKVHDG